MVDAGNGGADIVTVNDLTGTDVEEFNLDLAGSLGSGDGAVDRVTARVRVGDAPVMHSQIEKPRFRGFSLADL